MAATNNSFEKIKMMKNDPLIIKNYKENHKINDPIIQKASYFKKEFLDFAKDINISSNLFYDKENLKILSKRIDAIQNNFVSKDGLSVNKFF